ncbi:MAG: (2Fe-2S)-binding protein [Ornithinimicrobium sp.]
MSAAGGHVPLLIPVRAVEKVPTQGSAAINVTGVVRDQEQGRDATLAWRTLTHTSLSRGYPKSPPAVAATFVAQWVLQAVACATLFAVEQQQSVVQPTGPWIVLDPQAGYPREVLIAAPASTTRGDRNPGDTNPQAAYRKLAGGFIDGYRPGIPMSSRQRSGLVRDVWLAATRSSPSDVVIRQSCCLIFALPGLRCCAGCPRSSSGASPTSAVGEQGLAEAPSVEQS